MVLFYAWTDIQLINELNVKLNYFKDEKADLLIFHLNRLNNDYIQAIKKEQIFEQIYILELPDFYLERRRKGLIESAEMLINGNRLKKYFFQKLLCILAQQRYRLLLTGALWGETINVYRYLLRNNKKVGLALVEEGLSYYAGPKGWLYKTAPSYSIKAKIRELLYYGVFSYKARKNIKKAYMYQPEMSALYKKISTEKIPPIIQEKNPKLYNFMSRLNCGDIENYKKRKIIYIADAPRAELTQPYKYVYNMLDMITSIVAPEDLIVRMHPISASISIPFQYELNPQIYLDKSNGSIEIKSMHIDFEDKVILSNNSSVAFFMTLGLKKEPYIIFLHRLCAIDTQNEIHRNDNSVFRLGKMYTRKEKIMIPKSYIELKNMLQQCMKARLLG